MKPKTEKNEINKKISRRISEVYESELEKLKPIKKNIVADIIESKKIAVAREGKTKQYAQQAFKSFVDNMWVAADDVRDVFLKIIEMKKEGKAIYLYVPYFTDKYEMIIFSWMKGKGFIKRGDFLVFDPNGDGGTVNPKKGLNDKIREKGLPVVIGDIKNGLASKERMLYSISNKEDWIVDKSERTILGSMKVSFVANYCHYQARTNISIWSLYKFIADRNMEYLALHNIDKVDDFLSYMRVRRYDISCHKIVNTGLVFENPITKKRSVVCDAEFVINTEGINTIKKTLASIMSAEIKRGK